MTTAEKQALIDHFTKVGENFNKLACDAARKGDKEGVGKAFDKMGVELGIHFSDALRRNILASCPK